MAKKPFTAPAGKTAGKNAAPALAGGGVETTPGDAAGKSDAAKLAAKHGGNRGGKPREDGLVPGSPEARQADLDKDAARKRQARLDARPLPAEPAESLAGAGPAPGATLALPPSAEGDPVVPWQAEMLRPLTDELIQTSETVLNGALVTKCAKGRLPGTVQNDIKESAKWAPLPKKALQHAVPRLVAKYANKTGVSAEYQDEVVCAGAVLSIGANYLMLSQRIDKLIAAANPPEQKQPKPAGAPVQEGKP